MKWLFALALLLLAPTVARAQAQPTATAELRTSDGQPLATATFTQAPDQVLISIAFANRTALLGMHAIHVHSLAQCTAPTFESAGPIFNPNNNSHGLHNPNGPMAGDLPNLVIGPAGVAVYNISAPLLSVQMLAGRSLVIFAQPDDDVSAPEGNAGARIACGVINGPEQSEGLPKAVLIGLMGGLLFAGGIVLRRGA